MKVIDRVEIRRWQPHGVAHARLLETRSDQRFALPIRGARRIAGAAKADAEPSAAAVGVERDLGGGGDEGEVAAARANLVEAGADPAFCPDREADAVTIAPLRQRGDHRPQIELAGGNLACAGGVPHQRGV